MCDQSTVPNKNVTRIEDNILLGSEIPMQVPINVAETALNALKSKPDCIGQVDGLTGKKDTYADMSERSVKCALWLKKQGVQPRDIIGVCADNNLDAITVLLGIISINAICNTCDYELSLMAARYFLSITSPRIIFTITSSATSLMAAAKELKLDVKIVVLGKLDGYESIDDVLRDHDWREIEEFKCTPINNPDETGIIVYSSGTTGMPKAVEISHSGMHNYMCYKEISNMTDRICFYPVTIRSQYGISIALHAILSYSTRILIPETLIDIYTDCEYICKIIEKYRVTHLNVFANVSISFIKTEVLQKYKLPTLRNIYTTGSIFLKQYQETLSKKLPNVLIINGYGSTDAGKCTVQDENSKPGSVGFPVRNTQIKVTDVETEEALGINKVGEIRVKTPTVMNGYFKNPEATKNVFDSDGWLRTGDLGYYDIDGELFVVDRISEFIIFRGQNVSPAEIETVLQTHPAVFQAVVIGKPHEIDGQHPMAIVSMVPGKTVTEQELVTLAEKNLRNACRLRGGVKFTNKFPYTNTGKIARKQLREMFAK